MLALTMHSFHRRRRRARRTNSIFSGGSAPLVRLLGLYVALVPFSFGTHVPLPGAVLKSSRGSTGADEIDQLFEGLSLSHTGLGAHSTRLGRIINSRITDGPSNTIAPGG